MKTKLLTTLFLLLASLGVMGQSKSKAKKLINVRRPEYYYDYVDTLRLMDNGDRIVVRKIKGTTIWAKYKPYENLTIKNIGVYIQE